MIKNVPYLKNIDENLVEEILYSLKPKRYEAGTVIVKRGENVDHLMFLKVGEIQVEVPNKNSSEIYNLDTLNEGSCFCVYSAFTSELQ